VEIKIELYNSAPAMQYCMITLDAVFKIVYRNTVFIKPLSKNEEALAPAKKLLPIISITA